MYAFDPREVRAIPNGARVRCVGAPFSFFLLDVGTFWNIRYISPEHFALKLPTGSPNLLLTWHSSKIDKCVSITERTLEEEASGKVLVLCDHMTCVSLYEGQILVVARCLALYPYRI